MLASLVAAPQASAAACQYTKQDLPVPAGVGDVFLNGGSANNSRIVGQAQAGSYTQTLYWANGTLRQLPPAAPDASTYGFDVNNTGVIAGFVVDSVNGIPATTRAFRYENGAYEFLETDAGKDSAARAVNQAGDVAGLHGGDLYLWPRGGARKLIAAQSGQVMGISDDGKIVARSSSGIKVFDVGGGPVVTIPGGGIGTAVMDNDRVFLVARASSGELVTSEYDLNGVKVAEHPVNGRTFGRNGSGTVWGTYSQPDATRTHALWRSTGRTDVVADPMPLESVYSDITDAATLIGTHRTDQGVRPARWLWVCS
ncbi:hypothetical protein Lesp01_11570 [Lentzea sp. NBRC 102530]|nr:hypothetical protein Lesp01_11570 [Lentzea sp. NBRC 102530]